MSNNQVPEVNFTQFLSNAQQHALSSQKRDESQEYPKKTRKEYQLKKQFTAIAYHPKEQYFVVALEQKIYFYHLQIGKASILEDDISQSIDLNTLNDENAIKQYQNEHKNQIVTTMKFCPHQNLQDEHLLYVGTSTGSFLIISYNYNQIQIIRRQEKIQQVQKNSQPSQIGNENSIRNNDQLQQVNLSQQEQQIISSLSEEINELKQKLPYQQRIQDDQNMIALNQNIKYLKLHQSQISCILVIDDDQILTSSYDNTIKCIKKQIFQTNNDQGEQIEKMSQTLMEPKEAIYWISVSKKIEGFQRQSLISSGYDSFFYLWMRSSRNDPWEFKAKYQRNEAGSRVAYFGQNFLVWQLYQKDYIYILSRLEDDKGNKEVGQKIATKNIRKLQLNNEYIPNQGICDNDKFPILQNDELTAIKYGNKIYFLRIIQKIPTLQEKMTIECDANCTEGVLSPDGVHLIVFDNINKKLKVYKVNQY